mmetsp:Transcript_17417/g.44621  ORF Transcript_17417/g.44621 Transcript_17417/m.44621 type:complete len:212 (-) Transcript_17417:457-1092(-)
MYFLFSPRSISRKVSHVPDALHAARSGARPYLASVTFSNESKDVTMPSTTGKEPDDRTGECKPAALVADIAVTVCVMALAPAPAAQTRSPTATSLAFLSVEQHAAPTGRWCSPVRVSVLVALVVSTTKALAGTSRMASERSEMLSVVSAPSAVAATILSPSWRASTRESRPSAIVTIADEGKQGSSLPVKTEGGPAGERGGARGVGEARQG